MSDGWTLTVKWDAETEWATVEVQHHQDGGLTGAAGCPLMAPTPGEAFRKAADWASTGRWEDDPQDAAPTTLEVTNED